jgi:hypothetical protein|tara:strand:- start:650 stop:901 length:252 start_codon:yes stop_codon:yes gene_type:complete
MDEPNLPEWFPEQDRPSDVCATARMHIDSDTRICQVALKGPAAALLSFLTCDHQHSLIEKLREEANFDELVSRFHHAEEPNAD